MHLQQPTVEPMVVYSGAALICRSTKVLQTCGEREHNIIEQCAFVHVGPENTTMGCPNLVQIQVRAHKNKHTLLNNVLRD